MKPVKKYFTCIMCSKELSKGHYKFCSNECKKKWRLKYLHTYYLINKTSFNRRRQINRLKFRYLQNQNRLRANKQISEHLSHLNRFGVTEYQKPYEE